VFTTTKGGHVTVTAPMAWVIIYQTRTAMVNLCNKFEVCSFRSLKNRIEVLKLKIHVVDHRPLVEVVYHTSTSTYQAQCTKFEVSSFAQSKDRKGHTKFTKRDGLRYR